MSKHLSDYRLQITEVYQTSDIRQAANSAVCKMLPAKSLQNATCYLLSQSEIA